MTVQLLKTVYRGGRSSYKKQIIEVVCSVCNKIMKGPAYKLKTRKYCSVVCTMIDRSRKPAWNKGLTENTDVRVAKNVTTMRTTQASDRYLEKHKEVCTLRSARPDYLQKLSAGIKHAYATTNWRQKNIDAAPKALEKRRKTNLERYGSASGPKYDTAAAKRVEAWLLSLGIKCFLRNEEGKKLFARISPGARAFKECPVNGNLTDFYLPDSRTIIEEDGCYYHGCPLHNKELKQWQLDQVQEDSINTSKWVETGHRVIRIWEHETNSLAGKTL